MSLGFPYGGGGSGSGNTAIGNTVTSGTTGSVLFVGAGPVLAQDNANLFFDDTNNRLGVGTTTPLTNVHIKGVSPVLTIQDSNTNVATILLRNATPTTLLTIGSNSGADQYITSFGQMSFDTGSGSPIQISTGGVTRALISAAGLVGINNNSPSAMLHIIPSAAGTIGEIIKGAASQTASLTEWQNSAGTILGRIDASGFLGVGVTTPANAAIDITASSLYGIRSRGTNTGGTSSFGFYSNGTFASDVTASAAAYQSTPSTATAAYTLSSAYGVFLSDWVLGVGSAITTQYGMRIADQTKGTTNYGIYNQVASGSNKWGYYGSGTAQNYLAGSVGLGITVPAYKLDINGGSTVSQLHVSSSTADSGGYLTTTSADSLYVMGGLAFDGSSFVAKSTSASMFVVVSGETRWYGNSGLTAGNAYGPTEWMRLTVTGKLGIGEATANAKLQVKATTTATVGSNRVLTVDGTGTSTFVTEIGLGSLAGVSTANSPTLIGSVCRSSVGNTNADLYFATRSATTDTPATVRMTVQNDGLVGINTTAPTGTQLHVVSSAAGTIGEIVKGAASQTASLQEWQDSSAAVMASISAAGKPSYSATNTAAGTTGAQTINKPSGTVNFAAAATSLVVTNSLVSTSSLVYAVVRTNDTTAVLKNVVPASGSFTITMNAAVTAETSVGFVVFN